MLHDKIEIDTDYEIVSECLDIVDKGPDKGCIIVLKISGFKIKEKGEKISLFTLLELHCIELWEDLVSNLLANINLIKRGLRENLTSL